MHLEEVKKLTPLDRFVYWVQERHQVFLKKRRGLPKPWTDDEVLQSYFFTNPYRENDKVTTWFRENIRDPLRDDPRVILATIIFRWFNYIPTGELLRTNYGWTPGTKNASTNCLIYSPLCCWEADRVFALLSSCRDKGEQIFTGAYMINSPAGEGKLEAICRRIENVWQSREYLIEEFSRGAYEGKITMQGAHELLTEFEGLGGFMAYEIVCDLRYTKFLEGAPDKRTWCNPGPGAVRGLYRILERDFPKGNNATSPPVPKDWQEKTQWLLSVLEKRLPKMPPFEMREVEMSLCETDKYERLLWGDGRAKRKYNGRG